jgi:hypothetical protein
MKLKKRFNYFKKMNKMGTLQAKNIFKKFKLIMMLIYKIKKATLIFI